MRRGSRAALFDLDAASEALPPRPAFAVTPTLSGVKAFPYRGEGGPLAVDEVPTRTPDFVVSLFGVYDSGITANLSPALARGAGGDPLSVGSLCPRL